MPKFKVGDCVKLIRGSRYLKVMQVLPKNNTFCYSVEFLFNNGTKVNKLYYEEDLVNC